MKRFLGILNARTFLFLLTSQVAVYITIRYQLRLSMHPLLIGMLLAFPMGFALQAAFKRRDRAIEYLSMYKAGCVAVYQSIQLAKDLADEKKQELRMLLLKMAEELRRQLTERRGDWGRLQPFHLEIVAFLNRNEEDISSRIMIRVIRYMKDVTEGSVYVVALVTHGTMIGIRAFALMFIFFFPFTQAPIIYNALGGVLNGWELYALSFVTTFLLISLYHFQDWIEYPFDQSGPDNIKLNLFDLDI